MSKQLHRIRFGVIYLRKHGFIALIIAILQKLQKGQQRITSSKRKISFLVAAEDVVRAEWSARPFVQPKTPKRAGRTIVWVMSPPGMGGGHQNLFRFIKFLDSKGYKNKIYLYSTGDFPTISAVKERIASYYDLKLSRTKWLKQGDTIDDCDAIVATGWEPAYPVFNASRSVKKFYFVQDFEPLFYSMGSEYVLAENTYHFNFIGITAGGWLKEKLTTEYGMKCYGYDFGSESSLYALTNHHERKNVFFYARPVTTRRGFELGILALEKFHSQHPDYTIHFAGWDVSEYDIPFPYVNHKTMPLKELSALYNQCVVALVLSLTNMSLLPLELLACGAIPVVNDAENNRLVSNNPCIKYAQPSPDALALAMHDVVSTNDLESMAQQAAESVATVGWSTACETVMAAFEKELTNG